MGRSFFGKNVKAFDLVAAVIHAETMELYQAEYLLADLKYYIDRTGDEIYPLQVTLRPINYRYLDLVYSLRSMIACKQDVDDKELLDIVAKLGFKDNPVHRVVYGKDN